MLNTRSSQLERLQRTFRGGHWTFGCPVQQERCLTNGSSLSKLRTQDESHLSLISHPQQMYIYLLYLRSVTYYTLLSLLSACLLKAR